MKDRIKVAFSKSSAVCDKVFSDCDIAILGRKTFEKLTYKDELYNGGNSFSEMKKFSASVNAPCFIAVKTDDYGRIKRSVFVLEKGKLLAVCDANFGEEAEASSFGYKVVKTSAGKIGVVVSKDLLNLDCLRSLVLCESQLIINLYVDIYDYDMRCLVPSLGYLYGLPVISCGAHGLIASDGTGKTCFCSVDDKDSFSLTTKRTIKEITVKTLSPY